MIIAIVCGIIAGAAPVMLLRRLDLTSALKGSGAWRERGGHKLRGLFVSAQLALSVTLLVSAGLLVQSLKRLYDRDMGFNMRGLVTVSSIRAPGAPFWQVDTAAVNRLAETLTARDDVRAVARASIAPFGATSSGSFSIPRIPEPPDTDLPGPWVMAVSQEFFEAMGMQFIDGRAFGPDDRSGSEPVVIVNQAMSRTYWGTRGALGSCMEISGACARVVGVVETIREGIVGGNTPMRYYVPLAQQGGSAGTVIVRTDSHQSQSIAPAIRSILPPGTRAIISVVEDRMTVSLEPRRMVMILFTALALVAVLVASTGVFSVAAVLSSERSAELAIRTALGARPSDVLRQLTLDSLRFSVLGIAAGAILAGTAARFLASMLYGVSTLDPPTYLAAAGSMLLVTFVATVLPHRRVQRTSVVDRLRTS